MLRHAMNVFALIFHVQPSHFLSKQKEMSGTFHFLFFFFKTTNGNEMAMMCTAISFPTLTPTLSQHKYTPFVTGTAFGQLVRAQHGV